MRVTMMKKWMMRRRMRSKVERGFCCCSKISLQEKTAQFKNSQVIHTLKEQKQENRTNFKKNRWHNSSKCVEEPHKIPPA
mmetsp:Transcript_5366/g.6138  ORF Transcript_5366/g.6138 Transcript_5366/m.6138 type:complete len:80 (+) Transcript_5366:547-786(+)